MSFVERTVAPSSSDPHYTTNNPYYIAGYGMPNCTCYAWGRWYEMLGSKPNLSLGNANDWYGYSDGYKRSQLPTLGAVLCLYGGIYSGLGHVAIVEELHSNGDITVSESAYNGYYWQREKITKANGYKPSYGGYTFQGFIIPDGYSPEPSPTPTPLVGETKQRERKSMSMVFWRCQ